MRSVTVAMIQTVIRKQSFAIGCKFKMVAMPLYGHPSLSANRAIVSESSL